MNELEFSLGAAIGAGLVATLAMTAVMYMGRAILPAQMPMNILYMFGSMMTKSTGSAYLIGIMIHAVNGVIFAIIPHGVVQRLRVTGRPGWLGHRFRLRSLGNRWHGVGHGRQYASGYQGG